MKTILSAFLTLINHTEETHPHFESPRGQDDISAAKNAYHELANNKGLNQLEFSDADMDLAEKIAKRLGFTQYPYTSTSDLIGLNCLPDRATQKSGTIIKTKEFGFLFVQTMEDVHLQGFEDGIKELG